MIISKYVRDPNMMEEVDNLSQYFQVEQSTHQFTNSNLCAETEKTSGLAFFPKCFEMFILALWCKHFSNWYDIFWDD